MLLDIGAGILLGLWLGPFDSMPVNAALGTLFTLLPDADVFLYFPLRKVIREKYGRTLQDHRVFFHYPLPFLAAGAAVILILHPSLLLLFVAGTLEQFLHDSIGPGWGIPWLYPFSKKYFKFFYQPDLSLAHKPQKLMWVWSKEEQEDLMERYGDPDWHKHLPQLIKASPAWNLFELSVFVIGVIALVTR